MYTQKLVVGVPWGQCRWFTIGVPQRTCIARTQVRARKPAVNIMWTAQRMEVFPEIFRKLKTTFRTEDNFQQNVIEVHVLLLRKRRKEDPVVSKGSPRERRPSRCTFLYRCTRYNSEETSPSKGKTLATARKLSLRWCFSTLWVNRKEQNTHLAVYISKAGGF